MLILEVSSSKSSLTDWTVTLSAVSINFVDSPPMLQSLVFFEMITLQALALVHEFATMTSSGHRSYFMNCDMTRRAGSYASSSTATHACLAAFWNGLSFFRKGLSLQLAGSLHGRFVETGRRSRRQSSIFSLLFGLIWTDSPQPDPLAPPV